MKRDPKERFVNLVEMIPEAGCWLWTGAITNCGYGLFNLFGTNVSAHRAAWRLFRGEIPSDKHVLHRCDVKCCVNPEHLYIGTPADNAKDAFARGQRPTGDGHWRRRMPERQRGNDAAHRTLTEDQVREIRKSNETQMWLAKKYGVSQAQISRIILCQSWKHLLGADNAGQ